MAEFLVAVVPVFDATAVFFFFLIEDGNTPYIIFLFIYLFDSFFLFQKFLLLLFDSLLDPG